MAQRAVQAAVTTRRRGLARALALTGASAVVWGVAHFSVGRRAAGSVLLGGFLALVTTAGVATLRMLHDLPQIGIKIAARPHWQNVLIATALAIALLWATIVIRSYQVVRPPDLPWGARAMAGTLVVGLCAGVCTPFVWAAYSGYQVRGLTSIFGADNRDSGGRINPDDPWDGRRRVNILLLGGDAARNRIGVRTDSMTVASIDTRTGNTVLLGLPRNLQGFPMPYSLRHRFPNGFLGEPGSQGLLNEVYDYAENHPELVPGYGKKRRGPELLKRTIATIFAIHIDRYVLVDMFGFAKIIDAIGGVRVRIDQPIPYGQEGGVIRPGYRKLSGEEAMWYGRSRTNSDDYTRMGRQKCLLRAIARQADPIKVLTRFDKLASATKHAVSTDIPRDLLEPLSTLSAKVKSGAEIRSLQFVPPLIYTGDPDISRIRRLAARAITESERGTAPSAAQSPAATRSGTKSRPSSGSTAGRAKSLNATCPS